MRNEKDWPESPEGRRRRERGTSYTKTVPSTKQERVNVSIERIILEFH